MKIDVHWRNVAIAIGLGLSLWLISCGKDAKNDECPPKTEPCETDNTRPETKDAGQSQSGPKDIAKCPRSCPQDAAAIGNGQTDGRIPDGRKAFPSLDSANPTDTYSTVDSAVLYDATQPPAECPGCINPQVGCCIQEAGNCIVNVTCDMPGLSIFSCINCN